MRAVAFNGSARQGGNTAILLWGAFVLCACPAQAQGLQWRELQPGVELAVIPVESAEGPGDKRLTVVRIDPVRAPLRAVLAVEQRDKAARTAGEWCQVERLAVAINLGMFREDQRSHVGYLRRGAQEHSARWVSTYQSALAFSPKKTGLAPVVMLDLDDAGARPLLADYETVVQNLRLIKAGGQNMWSPQPKRWSEAAVAMDKAGRVLFLFSRTPYSMAEFNRRLLALPLDIDRAMHVEGGPQASLSIHVGGVDLDLFGSFKSGSLESDLNFTAWPVPNVLGVSKVARATGGR